MLLAGAGLARKSDLAIIMMVEKVVRENLLTHFERDVFFSPIHPLRLRETPRTIRAADSCGEPR
jgi:hypothetical protein